LIVAIDGPVVKVESSSIRAKSWYEDEFASVLEGVEFVRSAAFEPLGSAIDVDDGWWHIGGSPYHW
jgi:hypothetical protein